MSEATHNWPLIWEHLDTFLKINHAEQLAFWSRCHGQDCKRAIESLESALAESQKRVEELEAEVQHLQNANGQLAYAFVHSGDAVFDRVVATMREELHDLTPDVTSWLAALTPIPESPSEVAPNA